MDFKMKEQVYSKKTGKWNPRTVFRYYPSRSHAFLDIIKLRTDPEDDACGFEKFMETNRRMVFDLDAPWNGKKGENGEWIKHPLTPSEAKGLTMCVIEKACEVTNELTEGKAGATPKTHYAIYISENKVKFSCHPVGLY